jgi:hypothetical protein
MTQSKLRLNTDIRKKIGNIIRSHFEHENRIELENYKLAKQDTIVAYDRAFALATRIVQRAYPVADVETLKAFKKKYGDACDVVAKDNCFYFARPTDDNEKEVAKHFNFKLDASLNGNEYTDKDEFAFAFYRDELKEAGCNPDILIQHADKADNPTKTQALDKCRDFLGTRYKEGEDKLAGQWKKKYSLDVIGTSYCRSRTIPCSHNEFEQMESWTLTRGNLIKCHEQWISSIETDMKDVSLALRDYKYVSDAIELASKLGVSIEETDLLRTVGVSLTVYQPENLASMILSRRVKQDNRTVIEAFKKAKQQASVN